MKLRAFQPKEVIERQNKFIKDNYPFARLVEVILCIISAYYIVMWYFNISSSAKYLGMLAYASVFILKWYYFRQYDKQAENGFKRKWGTEELNKQNIGSWLCKNASFADNNVTIGSLSFFFVLYTVGLTSVAWVAGNLIFAIFRIIYYLICFIGLAIRIQFEGTHPAYATVEPQIDLAFGVAGIILMYALCLIVNKIFSIKILKCSRGDEKE